MRETNALEALLTQRLKAEWREEFERLVGNHRHLRPILLFLPSWWRDPHAGFAYFNIVAIGPGLPYAPTFVRNYVLAHELGHIDRRHTVSPMVFWLSALAAFVIGRYLSPMHAALLLNLLMLFGSAWILFGEMRRSKPTTWPPSAMTIRPSSGGVDQSRRAVAGAKWPHEIFR